MITVKQASEIILKHQKAASVESVSLQNALGRISAENWLSDSPLPPFDRVMMDGIAICSSDLEKGIARFVIQGIQGAGQPAMHLMQSGNALEVMTGAICPVGADVVVPYEDLDINDGMAFLRKSDFKVFQNIHRQGTDRSMGDILVSANTKIGPSEIGVAASIGLSTVQVYAKLRCAIFSTGDELVEVDCQPLPYQIRRSNVYALQALMTANGVETAVGHIMDDEVELKSVLGFAINEYDFVLLSGGVSKGKFDFLPDILEGLGVRKEFHRIAQKPGKPMWFGSTETSVVFALPGNPVSTLMCAIRYVVPWIKKNMSQNAFLEYARLENSVKLKEGMTHFLQVKIERNIKGETVAKAIPGNGSGDFANLVLADAFMEVDMSTPIENDDLAFPIYPISFSQF